MTSEDLADDCRIGVGRVKALLREGFPEEDFRPPGKTLEPRQVRYVREHLVDHLRGRRARGEDVTAVVEGHPPPASAAPLPAAPQSGTAHVPKPGGEHRLLLHNEVFHFLAEPRESRRLKSSVKRLMREMLVGGRSQRRVKSTRGVNAGWLRAPLGDNGGYHYYLWHALQGRGPGHALPLQRGDVAVRGAGAAVDIAGHRLSRHCLTRGLDRLRRGIEAGSGPGRFH